MEKGFDEEFTPKEQANSAGDRIRKDMDEREMNEQILQEALAIEQAAEEAMEMQMMQDMM